MSQLLARLIQDDNFSLGAQESVSLKALVVLIVKICGEGLSWVECAEYPIILFR